MIALLSYMGCSLGALGRWPPAHVGNQSREATGSDQRLTNDTPQPNKNKRYQTSSNATLIIRLYRLFRGGRTVHNGLVGGSSPPWGALASNSLRNETELISAGGTVAATSSKRGASWRAARRAAVVRDVLTTMRRKSRARDLVAPEILKPRWRQLSVAHGVLDILVPKVVLD